MFVKRIIPQKSESEASVKEIDAAMHIKTHFNIAPYQITAVCFEHEHKLVIIELQLVVFKLAFI